MIDGNIGYFQTWQFSLYKNIMSRLKVSEHRTLNKEEASVFVVPYDPGVHSYIDHNTGRPRLASPHGWTAIAKLQEAKKDPVFWAKHGHNHFVIHSVTGYQMVGIGTKVFYMTICQNCTVMCIETAPSNIAIAGRTRKYWYSVPYPSSIHWHQGIVDKPWVPHSGGARSITAIFIGSLKTKTAHSNALRRKLYKQCGEHDKCQWLSTAHACTGLLANSTTPGSTGASSQAQSIKETGLLLYRRSIFCLTPAGDSVTRKSIFDSYTLGCIPVVFARATLSQYFWHLSEEEMRESTVHIPKLDVIDGKVNFMKVLEDIPPEVIRQKQEAVAKAAVKLQYSVVPEAFTPPRGAGNDPSKRMLWKPPVHDATDVIIDRMLDPDTIEPVNPSISSQAPPLPNNNSLLHLHIQVNGLSDEEIISLQRQQGKIMASDPDYMGMSAGT